MTPLEKMLAKLPNAKKTPKGWSACCPVHEDRKASLSISHGNNGGIVLHCHAGCEPAAVVAKLGLTLADLMPSANFPQAKSNIKPMTKPNPLCSADQSIEDAVKAAGKACKAVGKLRSWSYEAADGTPLGAVIRWNDAEGKKEIRPLFREKAGWFLGAMPHPRPLYRLPKLVARPGERVLVVEGEGCCEVAESLGILVTTSFGGACAAGKTDWSPLASNEVIIWPDKDSPGDKYAIDVDRMIQASSSGVPATICHIVPPLELPEGGDIVDFVTVRRSAGESDGEIKRAIERLIDEAVPLNRKAAWPEIEPFDRQLLPDFPTQALPGALRDWVEAESHATQTPPDLAGLLALAVCSATIAKRVVVEARPGWSEPVNHFVAVLLEPGNRKSAVFTDALKPLRELEADLIEAARPAVAREQSRQRQCQIKLKKLETKAAEKNDLEMGHQAENLAAEIAEQVEPALPTLIVDDATSEKLGMMLAEQGGRIASMSPEGGVFDLMAGLYSKSGIPQFNVYLMGHSGDDLVTDRVSRKSVRVPRPALTCAYAMQPQVIKGLAANPAFRGRGLLARFLYSVPTSWIGGREIAPTPVPQATREAYHQVVRTLVSTCGNIGSASEPFILRLMPDASAIFWEWEAEIETMLGEGGTMELIRDWGAKLAGATLRLAAVLHCVEHGLEGCIDQKTIAAAVGIGRYLIPHAEAVLDLMLAQEGRCGDDARYVLRWIERHEKREFTKRDAHQHGKRRFHKANDIDSALTELIRRGYIRLRAAEATGPGRPSSPAYEVNPAALARMQTEKRSQYSQNAERKSDGDDSENRGGVLLDNPKKTTSDWPSLAVLPEQNCQQQNDVIVTRHSA